MRGIQMLICNFLATENENLKQFRGGADTVWRRSRMKMAAFPLNKGGSAKRLGVVRAVFEHEERQPPEGVTFFPLIRGIFRGEPMMNSDKPSLFSKKRQLSAAVLFLLCFFSGCSVGPKYIRPAVQPPPAYKEEFPAEGQGTEGWKTAQPSDALARGKWWELFNDSLLNSLEEQVNVSNQNIKAAEAQFHLARALVHANRAAYSPTVSTTPSVTYSHFSANRSIQSQRPFTASQTFTDFQLPLDLSYEADLWGRIGRTVEASQASAQASAADLETIRLSLHADLAADYFQLRALDTEKNLLDETVGVYEKALELTTNRYQGGIASQADVSQAQTQLEATRAQAMDVGVQRAQLEHAIAVLTGAEASTFSIPAAVIPLSPPRIPVGVPSELLERRPDIASAERHVAAANAQIGLAKTAFFPSLRLAASAGFESTQIGNWLSWPSRLFSIGPALALTLLDGGQRRAISDQAKAAYDASVADYRQTVLSAFQEVEDSLAAVHILSAEAKQQEAAVNAATRLLDISMNQYRGGVATYLQVTISQAALLSNQRASVDIGQRQMIANVSLVKALGGGWNDSQLPSNSDLKISAR